MKRSEFTVEELADGTVVITTEGGDTDTIEFSEGVTEPLRRAFIAQRLTELRLEATRAKIDHVKRSITAIDTWAELRKHSRLEAVPSHPPRLAEAAFAWLAPKSTVDAQLGDLQEVFAKNLERYGRGRARWLYWLQVIRAVAPALLRIARRVGLVGIIVDYVRGKIGL